MKKYWFTVHWPHPKLAEYDEGWHIFLRKEFRHLAIPVNEGDRVLFYETKKGKHRRTDNGTPIQLKKGRGGIVCAAEVIGEPVEQEPEVAHQEYEEGDYADWTIMIPCGRHQTGKIINGKPRIVTRKIVAAGLKQPAKGFFAFKGGLLEISREQFDKLLDLLTK